MEQQIGVIGLAVMGKNLALNMESKGYRVAVYNRSRIRTDELLAQAGSKNIFPTYSLEEFVSSLEKPRKIMLMVKAGEATDATIEQLKPLLDKGDILIDGGNTFFKDTQRRNQELLPLGIHFLGVGVSGGEEGALRGPAIMPGGQKEAYELVAPIFKDIAAKVGTEPCCTYIGPDGAGHFVKMVHNGIEYGDMQLIAESYFLLKQVLGLSAEELHTVFADWNDGELNSYLIEITADILKYMDEKTGKPLVDVILDRAGQKGTGKWTSQLALDLGIPLPIITESVFARYISALKHERVQASRLYKLDYSERSVAERESFIENVRKALYMSKLISYAQGFAQLKTASEEYNWNLEFGSIAMNFRGGCIIRATFLEKIKEAYVRNPQLANLLMDSYFQKIMENYHTSLREVIAFAVLRGIPIPCFSAALAYFDSYRMETLPANLIQAQRDYFGAHTYERVDEAGFFHTNWNED